MRYLNRLGILAAATTLSGGAALVGAGVAGAQVGEVIDQVLDSPSVLTVDRIDGQIEVSYSNGSGKALQCAVFVSNSDVAGDWYQWMSTTEMVTGTSVEIPEALSEMTLAAQLAGEWASGNFDVTSGGSGVVQFWEDAPLVQPENVEFAPVAVSFCQGDPVGEWATYGEVETSAVPGGGGGGGGALFGSLTGLIPALGS